MKELLLDELGEEDGVGDGERAEEEKIMSLKQ